ncbi:hypothetical protein V8E36_004534 [Tilletia maclaganii]
MQPLGQKRTFNRAITNAGSHSFPIPLSSSSSSSTNNQNITANAAHDAPQEAVPSTSGAATTGAATPFPTRPFKRSRTEPSINTSHEYTRSTFDKLPNDLPLEVKKGILEHLSLADAVELTIAQPDLRSILQDPNWSTWRKRWFVLSKAERGFDKLIASKNEAKQRELNRQANGGPSASVNSSPSTELSQTGTGFSLASQLTQLRSNKPQSPEEANLCNKYKDILIAFGFAKPPKTLDELQTALEFAKGGHVGTGGGPITAIPRAYLRKFARSLVLGSSHSVNFVNAPFCAFEHLDHQQAAELISATGAFLAVLRISLLYKSDSIGCPTRTARVLESDCRDALDRFFRPRIFIPPPGSSNRLTGEQQAFVDTDIFRGEVFKIQAYAGTGKTTSLIEYARRRPDLKMLYLAFNKAAQLDAEAKFPSNVICKTFHSFAFAFKPRDAIVGTLRNSDVVEKHLHGNLPKGESLKGRGRSSDKTLLPTVVASYVCATLDKFMSSADPQVTYQHVPYRMKQKTTLRSDDIAKCAQRLFDFINAGQDDSGNSIKCPHDGYVKMLQLRGARDPDPVVLAHRVLLLDEAQDMSLCQIDILRRTFPQWNGVVIVGDTHQKIYDFRGASDKLFDDDFISPTRSFQLTQSFRFGETVAAAATTLIGLKALPSWAKNQNKPRLSGLKSIRDTIMWANNSPADVAADRETVGRSRALPVASMYWTESCTAADLADVDLHPLGQVSSIERPKCPDASESEPSGSRHATGDSSGSPIVISDNEMSDDSQPPTMTTSSARTTNARRQAPRSTFQPIKHTRIYRSNAKLLRDAMLLAVESHRSQTKIKVFLKTAQSLNKNAILTLLEDAHKLYKGQPIRHGSFLKEYKSWSDLVQRVEAEEGSSATNSTAGIVVGLEDQIARPDWLQVVADLKKQFVDKEEEALIVMSTVHQAKGLEWDRVSLGDDFSPTLKSETVVQSEFSQQYYQGEINLMYVAATRAKKELYLSRGVMAWLATLNGYSRYELDDDRLGQACQQCNERGKMFLRRKLRFPRRDPLWVDAAPQDGDSPGPSSVGPSSSAIAADPRDMLGSKHYTHEWCTDCIQASFRPSVVARSAPERDFTSSVGAMQEVLARYERERQEEEHGVTGSAGTASSDASLTTSPSPAAALQEDQVEILTVKSHAREELWGMRLALDKVAVLTELQVCSGRERPAEGVDSDDEIIVLD